MFATTCKTNTLKFMLNPVKKIQTDPIQPPFQKIAQKYYKFFTIVKISMTKPVKTISFEIHSAPCKNISE